MDNIILEQFIPP